MAVTPQERQFLLDQVSQQANSDLRNLWGYAAGLATVEFASLLVDGFPKLADPYVELSSRLSATWFELSEPTSPYVAVTAPPIPVERLTKSAEWALGAPGDEGLARLEGSLQRAVYDGARDTIVLNVDTTGSYWVRHANANACAFCRMLATRHSDKRWWYRSAKSALDVVGRGGQGRGKRAVGSTGYHDHCRCIAVEVREGQEYEPPEYVQAWDDEYQKARANAGSGDPKKILAAWRQQGVS